MTRHPPSSSLSAGRNKRSGIPANAVGTANLRGNSAVLAPACGLLVLWCAAASIDPAWGQVRYPGPPPVAASAAAPVPAAALEGAQILARVGDEVILAGEVLGTVNAILEEYRDQIPASQYAAQRQQLIQQALQRVIESKLILVDARSKIPVDALPNIEQQVNQQFEEKYIPEAMQDAEASSRAELETKLRENGSSIELQRRSFFERSLVAQWVHQQIEQEDAVRHDEMYTYYQQHLSDYEHPARARWEQLTVRFDRHPTREAAYRKIAAMGNEVLAGRLPLAEIARSSSEGTTAADGGARDWTSPGALVSKPLDQALFSLPPGKLSTIIGDDDGLHIIRVVERAEAHRTPFRDAQVEIEEEIKKQRRKQRLDEYRDRLKKEIRVWTVFDDPATARRVFEGE